MSTSAPFLVQRIGDHTVVEFKIPSLMDQILLEQIGTELYRLVDLEDRRKLVLDFSQVQFISSQAIGIVIHLNSKITKLGKGRFVLCGVGPKLQELLRITRLDKLLTIKPSQKEALAILR